MNENDIIIIYMKHLFIIEVKAGFPIDTSDYWLWSTYKGVPDADWKSGLSMQQNFIIYF